VLGGEIDQRLGKCNFEGASEIQSSCLMVEALGQSLAQHDEGFTKA